MEPVIFVINPGSTSTKVALFKGDRHVFVRVICHDADELKMYPTSASQMEYRFEIVTKTMKEERVNLDGIDVFVGRGGF